MKEERAIRREIERLTNEQGALKESYITAKELQGGPIGKLMLIVNQMALIAARVTTLAWILDEPNSKYTDANLLFEFPKTTEEDSE